ncbi:hypothetical protein GCM10023156_31870 [Novipirellula rosea]|uniref:Uncharacterized protein n=1 Tax=Novipirellula rosea TaxID=1031540 RepID=A0ABP8MXM6_9BACT|tara:strand:- start:2902 stop:3732 length:831 start_codon:yes stop_codon:yes gene_type:complete
MTSEETPKVSARIRWFVSILICVHLIALVLPPLAFQTRGALGDSPSVQTLMTLVRDYTQFLYIDRGYAFFAPDPGPSHLIQAAITDASGETDEKMIPSLEDQWPRLLYHRHFMLAEYLSEIYQPPNPPEEIAKLDPVGAQLWEQSRARYEYVRQSIVDHLQYKNNGRRVVIRRIEHALPGFIELANDPIPLNDPRLYRVLRDQAFDPQQTSETSSNLPEAIPAPKNIEPDAEPSAPRVNEDETPPPDRSPEPQTGPETGPASPPVSQSETAAEVQE